MASGPAQPGSKEDKRGKITGPDVKNMNPGTVPTSSGSSSKTNTAPQITENANFQPGLYVDIDTYNAAQAQENAGGAKNPFNVPTNSNIETRNKRSSGGGGSATSNIQPQQTAPSVTSNVQPLQRTTDGMIRAAPESNGIVEAGKLRALTFYRQFKGGFFSDPAAAERARYGDTRKDVRFPGLESLGFAAGQVVNIASFGIGGEAVVGGKVTGAVSKAVQSSNVGRKVVSAYDTVRNTNIVTRNLFDLGTGVIRGTAAVETTKAVQKLGESKEDKQLISSVDFSGAVSRAKQAEKEQLQQGALPIPLSDKLPFSGGEKRTISFRSFAAELNPFFSNAKDTYNTKLFEEFKAQGLSETEAGRLVQLAQGRRRSQELGEFFGLLSAGASGEMIGRRNVAYSFEQAAAKGITADAKNAGLAIFKRTAAPIAAAGVSEGIISEVVQRRARGEDVTLKNVAISGAFGGTTAGLFGGTRAALAVNQPIKGNVLGGFLNIIDPYEKPGDIVEDIRSAAVRRITGRANPEPAIVKAFNPTDVLSFGTTTKSNTKTKQNNALITFGATPYSPVPTPTKTKTPTSIFTTLFGGSNIPQPLPIPGPPVPVTPDTKIPVPPPPITPINPFIPVPTPTPTPIPTFTPVTIPTATPIFRIPPPVPLSLPFSTGGGGSRTGKRRAYVNELDAGRQLLADFLGFQPLATVPKKRRKK